MLSEKQPGRVAVVTVASRGVGAVIAQRPANNGFQVVVNYSGGAALADAFVEALRQRGVEAIARQADVRDAAAVKSLFDAAESVFRGIDALVNSAGIMRLSPWAETDDDAFDR